jgi:hypothetical protein
MGGARALIASLGASFSLVAGAALSLLVISFVFAYDGLAGSGYDGAGANAQVVVPDLAATTARVRQQGGRSANAVVIAAAPAARAAAEPRPAARKAAAAEGDVEARQPAKPRVFVPAPTTDPTTSGSESQTPGAAGEGVRELGDSVSSAIGDTGVATTGVTATLGPPVSETVQELLNLINGLIGGATDGLGGALDSTLKR